jgi:hypothetical protein
VRGGCERRVGAYGHRGGGGRALGFVGESRLGISALGFCEGTATDTGRVSSTSIFVVEGDLVLGRVEGPAPGDDNPSSSSCRLILFGRTILFLIDNSRCLASTSGLSIDGERFMILVAVVLSGVRPVPSMMCCLSSLDFELNYFEL